MRRIMFLILLLAMTSMSFAQSPKECTLDATGEACAARLPLGASSATIQISRNFVASELRFEATVNESNWFSIYGTPIPSGSNDYKTSTTGVWRFPVAGYTWIRVRAVNYTSGNVRVYIVGTSGVSAVQSLGTSDSPDFAGLTIGGENVVLESDVRTKLTEDTTFNVSKTGSDSNGCTSASDACLTIQHAVDVISGDYDFGSYQATILVGAGTYSEGVIMGNYVGANAPIIVGDETTPGNVVVDSPDLYNCFWLESPMKWKVRGFHVQNDGSAYHLLMARGGTLEIQNMEFGDTVGYSVFALWRAVIYFNGNCEVVGDSAQLLHADRSSTIDLGTATITMTDTPNTGTTAVSIFGWIAAEGSTWIGSATGTRYNAIFNGVIYTGGGGANFFPGDVAGSTDATGGQYN